MGSNLSRPLETDFQKCPFRHRKAPLGWADKICGAMKIIPLSCFVRQFFKIDPK